MKTFALVLILMLSFSAAGTVTYLAPDTIVLSDHLVESELDVFDDMLRNKHVGMVELSDCKGARKVGVKILRHISEAIRERKLDTSVRGTAASGCAVIFLAGFRKYFLTPPSGRATLLFFHAAHLPGVNGEEIQIQATREVVDDIVRFSVGRIDRKVASRLLETKNISGGLFILREPPKYLPWLGTTFFCDGTERLKPITCESLTGLDASDLKILSK